MKPGKRSTTVMGRGYASGPARMVKTAGDAAMLVLPEVEPLLRSVVDLAPCIGRRANASRGCASASRSGPRLTRAGDWLGPPVNLASRLTAAAKRGCIRATDQVVDRSDGFE